MGQIQNSINGAMITTAAGVLAGEHRAQQAFEKDFAQYNADVAAVSEETAMGDTAITEQDMSKELKQKEDAMAVKQGVMEHTKNQVSKKQKREYSAAKDAYEAMSVQVNKLKAQYDAFNQRVQFVTQNAEEARDRLGMGPNDNELPLPPQRADYTLMNRGGKK